jgi:uncharacterized protein YeeX (DUF496 family)
MTVHEDQGRVHVDGHDTEHAAAKSISDVKTRRAKALQALQDALPGGLTDDEGGDIIGGDRLDFGRRRNELVIRGAVVATEERRLTPRGRKAIVWQAVSTGGSV